MHAHRLAKLAPVGLPILVQGAIQLSRDFYRRLQLAPAFARPPTTTQVLLCASYAPQFASLAGDLPPIALPATILLTTD